MSESRDLELKAAEAADVESSRSRSQSHSSSSRAQAVEMKPTADSADADDMQDVDIEAQTSSAARRSTSAATSTNSKTHSNSDKPNNALVKADASSLVRREVSKDWEFLVQFRAVMWRNFLIKRRRWVATLLEIALPVLVMAIMIGVQSAVRGSGGPNQPQDLHLNTCIPASMSRTGRLLCNDDNSTLIWDRADQQRTLMQDMGLSADDATSLLPANVTDEERAAAIAQLGFRGGTRRIIGLAPAGDLASAFKEYLESDGALDFTTSPLVPSIPVFPEEAERVRIFDTELAFEEYITDVNYGRIVDDIDMPYLVMGIIFESSGENGNYEYTIRAKSSGLGGPDADDTEIQRSPDTGGSLTRNQSVEYSSGEYSVYASSGFSYFQDLVDAFLIRRNMVENGLNADDFVVEQTPFVFQPFPVPDHFLDNFANIIGNLLGFLYTLFYLFSVTRIVKSIVEEKELRIRENMKIMGLQEQVLTVSWFATYVIIFVAIAGLTTLVTSSTLYEFSSGGYIFAFFFVFGIGVFAFSYMISAFFSRARIAAILGAILFLLIFFPFFAIDAESGSTATKLAGCLSLPVCFSLGVDHIAQFESTSIGVSAENAGTTFRNFSLDLIFLMMMVDFMLYMFLGWYLEQVLPSQYGSSRPWYFLAQPSYWSKSIREREAAEKRAQAVDNEKLHESLAPELSPNFEPASDELRNNVGISIRGLRKVFGTEGTAAAVEAVKGTNLDIFEGQILSLLGHNGAGKTTSINMLTGFYPPSSGDAFMLGSSITSDMPAIRKKMGVCPQHDVLYPILTVREHLDLYASIKGVKREDKEEVVEAMIDLIGLREAADRASAALSGGMKRKLSVGLALIGDSKIIFLDEPTSGMDTYSRQQFWDLLKSQKDGRTIVLTTHYMDEADYLGDRIAIMAEGRVKCWGTSLFLKNRFGVGYTMTVSKREGACDEDRLRSLVLGGIKNSTKLTNVATEISFRLPFKASSQFPDLFETLDKESDALGIESYGVSVTTLDEVFLRVSNDNEADDVETKELVRSLSKRISQQFTDPINLDLTDEELEAMESGASGHSSFAAKRKSKVLDDDDDSEEGSEFSELDFSVKVIEPANEYDRIRRDFRAMFTRHYIGARRDVRVFVCMCMVPFLILLVGLGILTITGGEPTSLALTSREMFNTPNIISYNGDSARGSALMAQLLDDPSTGFYEGQEFARTDLPAPVTRMDMQLSLLNNLRFAEDPQPEWQGTTQYSALAFDLEETLADSSTAVMDGLFFNTTAAHSFVAVLNQYNNILGRNATGNSDFKITMNSHPFPTTAEEEVLTDSIAGVFIGIAFAFIPAMYVSYVVRDRASKSKHQQMVSGASPIAYWLSVYCWDFIVYLMPAVLALIVFGIYGIDGLVGSVDSFFATLLLLLFYGLSIAPFSYLCSFGFSEHTTAQSTLLFVGIIGGAILPIVWLIMGLIESTQTANDVLQYFYFLFPPFALSAGVTGLITGPAIGDTITGPFAWESGTRPIVYMFLESILYFGLTLMLEHIQSTPQLLAKFQKSSGAGSGEEDGAGGDEDVQAEAARIEAVMKAGNQADSDEPIRIRGLRKEFGSKTAVKNLSFGIPRGQCFGFLGVNGAGKTTSLKMLTADILPTSGEAYLLGHSIATDQNAIRRSLGYCPQFDALIDNLTAREHLTLYCRIKGVEEAAIPAYVNKLVKYIGLGDWADKRSVTYSGGTKRKLSLGMALVGDPEVVFLDEPSTGMDPGSRRFMWNLISGTMKNRSVILTTHAMDEATALCGRIGIMVNGQLRCLGSVQKLKHRYGSGYQIDANVPGSKEQIERMQEFIFSNFGGSSKVIEQHGGSMKFRIDRKGNSLGSVFRLIETHKKALDIAEYSVSETTLEQIFNSFAKLQAEDSRN